MQSVNKIFKMSQEDPIGSHLSKYTMQMKPSAFGTSTGKHMKYEKFNCFITCKNMRKSTYILKVNMIWESGLQQRAKMESDLLGSFSNNYEFKRPIYFKRFPAISQNFVFEVCDNDSKQVLGCARFMFTPSHNEKDFFVTLPIMSKDDQDVGTLQAFFSRFAKSTKDFVAFEVVGRDLLNVDQNGDKNNTDKSDPFLIFHRWCNNEVFIPIHCTTAIMNDLNPVWERVILSVDELCGSDENNPIKIECWDWQEDLRYQFIGEVTTTLQKLSTKPTLTIRSRDPKNKTGELKVKVCTKLVRPTADEFLSTEDKFSFVLGIDYSVHNQPPYNKKDLHDLSLKGTNPYLQAIQEISKIMWGQDTDGKIPCFGFGGRASYPHFKTETVHQLIPLSGHNHKMSILSPEQLIEAYKNSLTFIEPTEPALISEIVALIKTWAARDIKEHVYYVVIILTAGHVDGLQQTIDILVEAAHLPISIVLVGIGGRDFSTLEKLDGDKRWLRNSKKKLISRDIVHFVDFEEFNGSNEKFSKTLLEEFPEQFMSFKLLQGYKPNVGASP